MSTDLVHITDTVGDGPTVLLVHGVGIGPESFEAAADLFAARGWCARVVDRGAAAGVSLEVQVDAIASLVDALGCGPVLWVGVSGGATLGVLAALRAPEALRSIVVHEPLVGPLAPELHARIGERAARLDAVPGDAEAVAFVRDLVGERTWADLPVGIRATIAAEAGTVRAEVRRFAAFAPPPEALAACRVPSVVTVGARSSPMRHDAALAAAAALGGTAVVVPGVGHLPQVDNPASFVATVVRSIPTAASPPAPPPQPRHPRIARPA
ncbi:MAG: alpha/beta hydrolase [Acidimicrobiales bacterium]|nr:alpha/beta hydrolase [Acidimicrobiales bacterium]